MEQGKGIEILRKWTDFVNLFKIATEMLRSIISLNTNLYYGPNIVTLNKTDPANQFEWLENTLNISQQNKEKVDAVDQRHHGMNRGLNLYTY